MDILAVILASEKKASELEALALKLINISDNNCEPWIAMGYHYLLSRKLTRALYLAHKVNHGEKFLNFITNGHFNLIYFYLY